MVGTPARRITESARFTSGRTRCASILRAEAGTQPEVDRARSYPLLKAVLAQHNQRRVVITGFMAQNEQGDTVLLGRNGSVFSATVICALAEV